jgi:hypothetical protein
VLSSGRVLSYGKNLKPMGWSWSGGGGGGYGKSTNNGFSRFGTGDDGGGSGILSHSSTVERLYAWEKKLFLDVKVRSSATRFVLHYLPASILLHPNVQ